jgi:hypothetical protein
MPLKVQSMNKPNPANLDLLSKLIFDRINAKPELHVVGSGNKQAKK